MFSTLLLRLSGDADGGALTCWNDAFSRFCSLHRAMFSGTWRQTPSVRTNDSTLELAANNVGSATKYPMLQPCSLGSNKLLYAIPGAGSSLPLLFTSGEVSGSIRGVHVHFFLISSLCCIRRKVFLRRSNSLAHVACSPCLILRSGASSSASGGFGADTFRLPRL